MTQLAELERRIEEKKREIESARGSETEIYTRIVGYYRSLKNWNKGKKEEFTERKTFDVGRSLNNRPEPRILHTVHTNEALETNATEERSAASYIFFYRDTCPNCPAMKTALSEISMEGTSVNVDTDEGFDLAKRYEILSTPHVVFLSDAEEEVWRSGNPVEVRATFESEELAV